MDIAATAGVGSGVFGAISAYNGFGQTAELKEINAKLNRVIGLQLETLQATKDLGIQIRQDLEVTLVISLNQTSADLGIHRFTEISTRPRRALSAGYCAILPATMPPAPRAT